MGTASDPQLAARAGQHDSTRELGLFGRGRAVGNVNLRAKGMVTIKGIGATADGPWYASCVRHEVKDRHYETRFWTTR